MQRAMERRGLEDVDRDFLVVALHAIARAIEVEPDNGAWLN